MKKDGLIGWIILWVLVGILVIATVAGIYLYNFHVFKTVRVCVGEGQDTLVTCDSTQECMDLSPISNTDFKDAPLFLKDGIENIIEESIYCDTTCFVKEIRGIDNETQAIETLDSCMDGEVEFVFEIHGDEALQLFRYFKDSLE